MLLSGVLPDVSGVERLREGRCLEAGAACSLSRGSRA